MRIRHTKAQTQSPIERFYRSMVIDRTRWQDGEGYDLSALAELNNDERATIETELIPRATEDGRNIEALATLGTAAAVAALQRALECGDHKIEMAVLRYAQSLVDVTDRARTIVKAIRDAEVYGGLSEALDEVVEFHPPAVHRALMRALMRREGEVAMLIAGLLFHIHGKTDEPFDWALRPFFLRFHTEDPIERKAAVQELCTVLDLPLPP